MSRIESRYLGQESGLDDEIKRGLHQARAKIYQDLGQVPDHSMSDLDALNRVKQLLDPLCKLECLLPDIQARANSQDFREFYRIPEHHALSDFRIWVSDLVEFLEDEGQLDPIYEIKAIVDAFKNGTTEDEEKQKYVTSTAQDYRAVQEEGLIASIGNYVNSESLKADLEKHGANSNYLSAYYQEQIKLLDEVKRVSGDFTELIRRVLL